jgi:hypothetical protein
MVATELAHDLALALDPVLVAEATGLYLDKWQRDVLRSVEKRLLLNVTRQGGKSSTVAVLACHTALYKPRSLTLILSPGERQSKETFRKVMDVYHAIDHPVPAAVENKLELELRNGSRIVALPGVEGTIRGYSGVDLLVVDEASRVRDETMAAVRPMLAISSGRLLAMSTPFGKRGWWYAAWEEGGPTWERMKVTADQCPRISPAFLDEERRMLGEWWYQQEYQCTFVDALSQYFSSDDVLGALSADVVPLPW